jgi:hypothetical protein
VIATTLDTKQLTQSHRDHNLFRQGCLLKPFTLAVIVRLRGLIE